MVVVKDILQKRIHPSLGGISLGCVGLAACYRAVCEVHGFGDEAKVRKIICVCVF